MTVSIRKPGARPLKTASRASTKERTARAAPKRDDVWKRGNERLTLADIHAMGGDQPATPVKTRFAPSPTGDLHIGSCMIGVLNYLAAKSMGGDFVLRIEDTDPARSKPEFIQPIQDALEWLGLKWDGDIVYQSQNQALYQEKAEQLVAQGLAYRNDEGSIFLKLPENKSLTINDAVKGAVKVELTEANGFRDLCIWRSAEKGGGAPFAFANAVDDIAHGITHVIRGDDHFVNTAKQLLVFHALGARPPEFSHIGLILDDAGKKLSKRRGAAAVLELRDLGYDPDVILNHITRLATSFPTDETLSLEQLTEQFDHTRLSTSASQIGYARLDVRSREALAGKSNEVLVAALSARAPELVARLGEAGTLALIEAGRNRVATLGELVPFAETLLEPVEMSAVEPSAGWAEAVSRAKQALQALPTKQWNGPELEGLLQTLNTDAEHPLAEHQKAMRAVLTGMSAGLPLHATLAILGKKESVARLRAAMT